MLLSKSIIKDSIKGLKISTIVGFSTLMITGGFIHNDLYATTTTPTTYNISELTSTLYRQAPSGYVKPAYTFNISATSTQTTSNELSPTDAAEIMSQELYRYLKVDLTGKTIEISHQFSKHGNTPNWRGDIKVDPLCMLHASIDPVTGELNFISRQVLKPITSNSKPDNRSIRDIENAFKRNSDANCKKVETLITTSGCLSEKIKSVTFESGHGGSYVIKPQGKENSMGDYI